MNSFWNNITNHFSFKNNLSFPLKSFSLLFKAIIMVLVELTIKGISYSQAQSGAYALILTETKGNRNLPIVIGAFEAQSIAIGLEKEIDPPRPITHDLMYQCFERFKIRVKQVIIHTYQQ